MGLFAVALGGFWMAQVGVAILFQYGSTKPGRWLRGYVIGNTIGVSSTLLLLMLLRMGDSNVVTGLAVGGGFLAQQIALVLIYKGRLTLVQALGVTAIVAGMLCLGMGAKG